MVAATLGYRARDAMSSLVATERRHRGLRRLLLSCGIVVWTAANAVVTMVAMVFGAGASGRGFRVYSIASIVVVLAAGVVTSRSASELEADVPLPG